MRTDLREFAARRDTTGPYADHLEVDALIVGAGFSGIYILYKLRKLGLRSVVYEAGTNIGGTWRWNRYPGACVDSQVPAYEYSIPEVWEGWTWTTNYPGWEELGSYFDHVEKVLNIKKDCAFETVVVDAQFSEAEGKWHVRTQDGRTATCKYFIVAVGSTAKRYIPNFKGLESYQGVIHHSAFWPEEGVETKGKRVAVIGTGPTGLQVIQELAPKVESLTVFQRTPVIGLPINRRRLTAEEQRNEKTYYPTLFGTRELTFGGFFYGFSEKLTSDDSPEEQEAFFQDLWDQGGFTFWLANYKDVMIDSRANRLAYDFWAKKVRARIGDPAKRHLLAPLEPPHPFATRRPCLEQNYYEQFNRANVDLVDISTNAIKEFTSTGIVLGDGTFYELDVVAVCTGFDATTGGMTNMGIRNIDGTALRDEWAKEANTYLGITIKGYPNMFHLYGTHSPGLISNAPAGIEIQGRLIADIIKKMEREKIKYINPTAKATETWKQQINDFSNATLFSTTRSNLMGGNFPGKPFEQVNFLGGMSTYASQLRAIFPDLKGFDVVKSTRRKFSVIS